MLVQGSPGELKALPQVTPEGTRRLEVRTSAVTDVFRTLQALPGVREATIFGESVHLLVDATLTEAAIRAALSPRLATEAEVREIAPSLEDVFVTMTRNAGRA